MLLGVIFHMMAVAIRSGTRSLDAKATDGALQGLGSRRLFGGIGVDPSAIICRLAVSTNYRNYFLTQCRDQVRHCTSEKCGYVSSSRINLNGEVSEDTLLLRFSIFLASRKVGRERDGAPRRRNQDAHWRVSSGKSCPSSSAPRIMASFPEAANRSKARVKLERVSAVMLVSIKYSCVPISQFRKDGSGELIVPETHWGRNVICQVGKPNCHK